jgi:HEAT repeat protein
VGAVTPGARIQAECLRRGAYEVVSACVDLLAGRDVDDALLIVLGGVHATAVLDGYNGGKHGYWPRVWATRGLLYAWDDGATTAVIAATTDTAWRVREMAAKVIARHRVGEAINAVARLRTDPVERVRLASERAVRILAGSRA